MRKDPKNFRERFKHWKETGEYLQPGSTLPDTSSVESSLPGYDDGKDGMFVKYVNSYRVNPETGGVYDKTGEVAEGSVILPEVEVIGKPIGKEAIRREAERMRNIQSAQGLSGSDPVGQFAVEGAALSPVFKVLGTAGLYTLGRYGESLTGFTKPQNWARAKLLTREMDRSPFGTIGSPVLHPIKRTKVGDVEIDNTSLLYHLDRGDGIGAFSNQGAYVENGFLMPGTPKDASATPYSWWNKGKPYATYVEETPMTRLMIASEDTPGMLHVRSQNYRIGQWNGQRGFVLNSEYVNPKGVDVSGSTFNWEPGYGWRKTIKPVSTYDLNNNVRWLYHGRHTNRGPAFQALRNYSNRDVGLHLTENLETAEQFAGQNGVIYKGLDLYGTYPDAIYDDIVKWQAHDWDDLLRRSQSISPELEQEALQHFSQNVVDGQYGKMKTVRDLVRHFNLDPKEIQRLASISRAAQSPEDAEVANKMFAKYLADHNVNFIYHNDFEGGGFERPSVFISNPSRITWFPFKSKK